MWYKHLLFLFFFVLPSVWQIDSLHAQSRQGKDYALFFANDDYRANSAFSNLKNPITDANALQKELGEVFDFEIKVYPNLSKEEIYKQLKFWRNKTFSTGSQLFIFFSGHGTFDEFEGKGYFVPNGKSTDVGDYIDLSTLGNIVTKIPCDHILLAIDACYSGTIDQRIALSKSGGFVRPGSSDNTIPKDQIIERQLRNKSRLLITSGGKERTSDGIQHSPFTKALLNGLQTSYVEGNGLFIWPELLTILQKEHPKSTQGKLFGHNNGGFVFVAKGMVKKRAITTQPDNFVFVKGGSFQMGSDSGSSNEKPVHKVTLSDFYIGRHEVTVDDYLAFARATNTHFPDWMEKDNEYNIQTGSKDYYKKFGSALTNGNHPIVGISWYDAVAYCNWLSQKRGLRPVYTINGSNISANWQANGYRLPTEAEWEYTARSRGKQDKWAGTSNESSLAKYGNFCDQNCTKSWKDETQDDRYKFTAPVGSFQPNSLGLYDMSGNVYEWCWDWYNSEYYSKSANTNPKGTDTGSSRVIRGGSWYDKPAYLRCANRDYHTPDSRLVNVGFRLSRAGS